MPSPIPAISEDYSDIIVKKQLLPFQIEERYQEQPVDRQYSILYAPLSENLYAAHQIGYISVPKLYTFISLSSLERSGILSAQTQPYLRLLGTGILIGFLDSGIDYRHPAFRKADGTTRIAALWDQSDSTGIAPEGFSYGSEYQEDTINQALFSKEPYRIVPSHDFDGHGTAVAGIACGSADPESDFTGAAPDSTLAVVKLKPAKQYLRDYFLIPDDATAFQENDLMLGIRYLIDTAIRLRMPLVICISLGSNQGSHTGNTPLEEVLSSALLLGGTYVVAGTGNEAGMSHHYYGKLNRAAESAELELLIRDASKGVTLEFWAEPLELYDIGFTSPLGESIQPTYYGPFSYREFTFALENTKIYVYYSALELSTGQQVIQIRIEHPSTGIWRLHVVNRSYINGSFHLWLPITGLSSPGTFFTAPNPDTTLVIPSCASSLLSVAAYDADSNRLFLNSGRGYTQNEIIKPDLAAPGVSVTAPVAGGGYEAFTGSCAASALTAGATALLAQGGRQMHPPLTFTAQQVKMLFLRGSRQSSAYVYPNREWGYGTLDLYHTFESIV